jgi:hypothetical protein
VEAKVKPPKPNVAAKLGKLLQAYAESPIFEAAFTLPSSEFDYWWLIEFGTGSKHQSTADTNGLKRPTSVDENQGRAGDYPIVYKDGSRGVSGFLSRKRLLRFVMFGQVYYRALVMHPGSRPANRGRGMVRLAIRTAQIELKKTLSGYKRRKKLPARHEVVNAVNGAMHDAFVDLKRLTPVDPDSPHPTHLRDAWRFRKAR